MNWGNILDCKFIRSKVRMIADIELKPGSATFNLIFSIARILFRLRILKHHKHRLFFFYNEHWFLVKPLCGTSTFMSLTKQRFISPPEGAKVSIITRDIAVRCNSFFNKKVRNPNTIGKTVLLAKCGSLNYHSNILDFLQYLESNLISQTLEPHLLPLEIDDSENFKVFSVLDLDSNRSEIERLLGTSLGAPRNSSSSMSKPPLMFDVITKERIRSAYSA